MSKAFTENNPLVYRKDPVFHRAHYNKIAALLGRHIRAAAKTEAVEKDGQITIKIVDFVINNIGVGIVGEFVVMFEKDNERFDKDIFLKAVVKHATE